MIDPPPSALHLVDHRLRGEELVPQIHGEALVPVFDRHLLDAVAIIARGVVHQHGDVSQGLLHARDARSQRVDVAQIPVNVERRWPACLC